jgi:hypothetical protein
MKVSENGKEYIFDDRSGLIVEAHVAEDESESIADEFRIGDRVEVVGKVGSIISVVPSMYGMCFGVRFDDGSIDEFGEPQMKRSSVEQAVYDLPVDEVFARFSSYEEWPTFTDEEIERKEREARWLNLRASGMRSDAKLDYEIQNELSKIVLVTSADITDLKVLRVASDREENQQYLSSFNQYRIASDISGSAPNFGIGASGDASWLDTAYDGMELVESTDSDLASRATEVVAQLTREQLENDEFMTLVSSFQNEYLRNDDGREQKFATYLARARDERLKELPQTEKKASSHEDLHDVPDAAIFL